MQRVAGLSKLLVDALLPLCLWGMISSLMLLIIEIRSAFLVGGESRLRLAVVAFSAGVVLIQRLGHTQGESVARTYSFAVGAVMFLFAAVYSYQIKFPIPAGLAALIHCAIFGALWWVGHQTAKACSASSDFNQAAVSEGGSLPRLNLNRFVNAAERKKEINQAEQEARQKTDEKIEARWKDKLSGTHPGRVILYFSLFAIPVFGVARFVLSEEVQEERNVGGLLFIYLWCALSLLFLSSLNQLAAYFKNRKVSLPEPVAAAWLSIGLTIVTVALSIAFFLPGPASPATDQVRAQITGVYRGWEGKRGFDDRIGSEPKPGEGAKSEKGGKSGPDATERGKGGSGEKDPGAKQKGSGGNKPKPPSQTAGASDMIAKTFRGIFQVILGLGVIAAVFGLVFLLIAFWSSLTTGIERMRMRAKPKKKKPKKKTPEALAASLASRLPDPFRQPGLAKDSDALVRYMWEAMLAWCAEEGEACPADVAATEFVGRAPESLKGFEEKARYIAELINFSEFSSEPIPSEEIPRLKQFWNDLQGHMAGAG